MSLPTCNILVGLPGTGKSTLACYSTGYEFVYSTDKFIEDIAKHFGVTYNEAFAGNIEAATLSMDTHLAKAIAERRDIIWDQTNLTVSKRKRILERFKDTDYVMICTCIMPPTEEYKAEWRRRLDSRVGKTIPEEVLAKMVSSYWLPTASEGFDRVDYHDMYANFLSVDLGIELD